MTTHLTYSLLAMSDTKAVFVLAAFVIAPFIWTPIIMVFWDWMTKDWTTEDHVFFLAIFSDLFKDKSKD